MNEAADFAGTPTAVARSRAFAERLLDGADEETTATVLLLVSELASNAVRHASSGFTLAIEQTSDQVRVTVTDGGNGALTPQRPSPSDPSGRGLLIIDLLADDWGVIEHANGKSVWATLISPAARARRPAPDR